MPKYCQFCGLMACLVCCHKTRKFQPKPGQSECASGISCRVCDRKFIHQSMKSTEMEHAVFVKQWELNEQENVLTALKEKCDAAKAAIKL